MGHETATDQIRERASLYAVGALSPDEMLDFERHLHEGCSVCQTEVDGFQEAAVTLPLGLQPMPAHA